MADNGKSKNTTKKTSNAFLAGGIAGMVAQTTIAPVDRMKILLQAQNEHYKHLSLYRVFRKIAAFEGVRAYFRGNGTQMLRVFPSRAIIFGLNDGLKQSLPASPLGRRLGPHATSLLAGSVAGTVAISVTFPLDMVMARLAYHTPGSRRYAGIWDAARNIFAEEGGLRGLYRGFSASLLAVPVMYGVKFYIFDRLSASTVDRKGREPLSASGLARMSACGAVAATVAVTVVHPLDVARRRMQLSRLTPDTEKFGKNIMSTFVHIYKDNGIVRGLYRGLSLNYVKAVPYWSVAFMVNEFLREVLDRS